jgi:hypothetical protein
MMMLKTTMDDDDIELVSLALPLDRDTIAWLNKLARDDVEAARIIASMLHDIRIDDEAAHSTLH